TLRCPIGLLQKVAEPIKGELQIGQRRTVGGPGLDRAYETAELIVRARSLQAGARSVGQFEPFPFPTDRVGRSECPGQAAKADGARMLRSPRRAHLELGEQAPSRLGILRRE